MILWIFCSAYHRDQFYTPFYLSHSLQTCFLWTARLILPVILVTSFPMFVIRILMKFLRNNITKVFLWFQVNILIANSSKSHFLVSPYENMTTQILNASTLSSCFEELLGIENEERIVHRKYRIQMKIAK